MPAAIRRQTRRYRQNTRKIMSTVEGLAQNVLKFFFVYIFTNFYFLYKLYRVITKLFGRLYFEDPLPKLILSLLILAPPLMIRPALLNTLALVAEYLFIVVVIHFGIKLA